MSLICLWGSFQPDSVPCGLSAWGRLAATSGRQQDNLSSWPPGTPRTFPAALCPHLSTPARPSTTPVDPRHPAFTPGADLAPGGWRVWPPVTCRNKCLSFLLKCCQKTDGGVSFSGCGSFADPQSGWHSVVFLSVILTYSSDPAGLSDVVLKNLVASLEPLGPHCTACHLRGPRCPLVSPASRTGRRWPHQVPSMAKNPPASANMISIPG